MVYITSIPTPTPPPSPWVRKATFQGRDTADYVKRIIDSFDSHQSHGQSERKITSHIVSTSYNVRRRLRHRSHQFHNAKGSPRHSLHQLYSVRLAMPQIALTTHYAADRINSTISEEDYDTLRPHQSYNVRGKTTP